MADLFGERIDQSYIYVLNSTPGTNVITNGDGSAVDWDASKVLVKTGSQTIDGQKNFVTIPHISGLEILFKNNNLSGLGEAANSLITSDSVGAAIFLGDNNLLSGRYSVILAGELNELTGNNSLIGAGKQNYGEQASLSFIGAGSGNALNNTENSAILVGKSNTVTASNRSAVLAGQLNLINGASDAGIGAGAQNEVKALEGFVGGGNSNKVLTRAGAVLGGSTNTSSGQNSTVGGGTQNLSLGSHSAVLAGRDNIVNTGQSSAIVGGDSNLISGDNSVIGAGSGNNVSGNESTIIGGENNLISGNASVIGGGIRNTLSGNDSVLVGGTDNVIFGDEVVLVGGKDNTASGRFVTLFAGENNNVTGIASTIVAGRENDILNSDDSSITAGNTNFIKSSFRSNMSAGTGNTLDTVNDSFIGAGVNQSMTSTIRSFIGVGSGNSIATSRNSLIGAGIGNQIVSGTGNSISSADISSIRTNTDVLIIQKKLENIQQGIANTMTFFTYGYSSLFCKFPPKNNYQSDPGFNISNTESTVRIDQGLNQQNPNAIRDVHVWDGTNLSINTGKFIESGFFQPPQQASVINGIDNIVESDFSTIINGSGNILAGANSIVAGINNKASGQNSYIFGGSGNSIDVNLRLAHAINTGEGYERDTSISNLTVQGYRNSQFSSGDFVHIEGSFNVGDEQFNSGQVNNTFNGKIHNPYDNFNTIINGIRNKISSNKADDYYAFLDGDNSIDVVGISTESRHAHIIGGEDNTIDGKNAFIINGMSCSIYPQKKNLARTFFHAKPGTFGLTSAPGGRLTSNISNIFPLEGTVFQTTIPELSGLEVIDFVYAHQNTSDKNQSVYESNSSIQSSIRCEISGGFSNIDRSLNCKILTPETNSSMPRNTTSSNEDCAASKYGFFNSIYNSIGSNISGSHHSSIFNGIGNQIRFDDSATKDSDPNFLVRSSTSTILNGVRNVIEARDDIEVRQPYDTHNNNYSTILNGTENTIFGKFSTVANGTGNIVGGVRNFVFGKRNQILSGTRDNLSEFFSTSAKDRPASSSFVFGTDNVIAGQGHNSDSNINRENFNTILGRRNFVTSGDGNFIHGGVKKDPLGSEGTPMFAGPKGNLLVGQKYTDTENVMAFGNERSDIIRASGSFFANNSGFKSDNFLTSFRIQDVGSGMTDNPNSFNGIYTGSDDGTIYQHTVTSGLRVKLTGNDDTCVLCDDDPANTYSHNRIAWSGGHALSSSAGFFNDTDFYKENVPYQVSWTGGEGILDGTITNSSSPRFTSLQKEVLSKGFSGISNSVITNNFNSQLEGAYTSISSSQISQVSNASGHDISRSRIGLSTNSSINRAILTSISRSEIICFDESTLDRVTDSKVHGRINTITPGSTRTFTRGNLMGADNTITGGFDTVTVHGTGNTLVQEGTNNNSNIHTIGFGNLNSGDQGQNIIFGSANTGVNGFIQGMLLGTQNIASGCTRTHIYGFRNIGRSLSNAFILGEDNEVSGSLNAFVFGENNTSIGNHNTLFNRANLAEGTGDFSFNTNTTSFGGAAVGGRITGHHNFHFGTNNHLNLDRGFVVGRDNAISGGRHIVFGTDNDVTGVAATVIGNHNNVGITLGTEFDDKSFIHGSFIGATGRNMIAIGQKIEVGTSGAVINDSRYEGTTQKSTGKGPRSLFLDFESGTHINLPSGSAANISETDGVPGSIMYSGEFLLVKTGSAHWGKVQITSL